MIDASHYVLRYFSLLLPFELTAENAFEFIAKTAEVLVARMAVDSVTFAQQNILGRGGDIRR